MGLIGEESKNEQPRAEDEEIVEEGGVILMSCCWEVSMEEIVRRGRT